MPLNAKFNYVLFVPSQGQPFYKEILKISWLIELRKTSQRQCHLQYLAIAAVAIHFLQGSCFIKGVDLFDLTRILMACSKARRSASPDRLPLYRAGSAMPRAGSVPRASSVPRALSVPPLSALDRISPWRSLSPLRSSSVDPFLDDVFASKLDRPELPFVRSGSPTPVKPGRWGPRPSEIAYDSEGLPVFHPRNRFRDMFEPSPHAPISSFTRDPFWWDIDDLAPYYAYPRLYSPALTRNSFLSPVKNRYLWGKHPIRPLFAN